MSTRPEPLTVRYLSKGPHDGQLWLNDQEVSTSLRRIAMTHGVDDGPHVEVECLPRQMDLTLPDVQSLSIDFTPLPGYVIERTEREGTIRITTRDEDAPQPRPVEHIHRYCLYPAWWDWVAIASISVLAEFMAGDAIELALSLALLTVYLACRHRVWVWNHARARQAR